MNPNWIDERVPYLLPKHRGTHSGLLVEWRRNRTPYIPRHAYGTPPDGDAA